MDNWNAPQWVDFNASLMADGDEYFDTEHRELETRYGDGLSDGTFHNSPNSKASDSNSLYNTPRSNRGSNSLLNKTECLISSMRSLQIKSAQKALTRQSMTASPLRAKRKTIDISLTISGIENDENIETKLKPAETATVTKVCENNCAEIPSQEDRQDGSLSEDNSKEDNADNMPTLVAPAENEYHSTSEPVEKVHTVEAEKTLVPEDSPEQSATVTAKEIPQDRSETEKKLKEKRSKLSKLKNPLDPPQRGIFDKKIVRGNPAQPTVLTSQARRHSLVKYRRRSNRYVSLAEAVSRFQHGTPERFRSMRHKDNKAGPLLKPKQTTFKPTCPMSPALRCKSRTRKVLVPNQEPDARVKQIPKASAANPPLRKFETKSKNFPRSFPSAQEKSATNAETSRTNEKTPPASSSEHKTTMHPPKVPSILKKVDKMLGESICSKDTIMISTTMMSESMRKHTPCKRTVPTVVSTDEGAAIKNVEILHFGIPVGDDYKKITRTIPFSFDTRNKELQSKREKLKNQQIEEERSKKSLFQARPAPLFNEAKTTTSVLKSNENNDNRGNPMFRIPTLKERTELALKKKKELMDRIVEKEKQARVFHAKPAPSFKPVFVRGNATENLRSANKANAKS